MGVGAGLYMYGLVKKFTFAISSPDECLFNFLSWSYSRLCVLVSKMRHLKYNWSMHFLQAKCLSCPIKSVKVLKRTLRGKSSTECNPILIHQLIQFVAKAFFRCEVPAVIYSSITNNITTDAHKCNTLQIRKAYIIASECRNLFQDSWGYDLPEHLLAVAVKQLCVSSSTHLYAIMQASSQTHYQSVATSLEVSFSGKLFPHNPATIIRPHRPYYVRRCGLLLPSE